MPANTTSAPAATSLDCSDESATTALYRAAIGPVNADYYLPLFIGFETTDRADPSWNWASSLYTLNWLLFRRLWSAAQIYVVVVVGVALMIVGIGRLVFQISETVELGLWVAFVAVIWVIPGVYGNAWLHAACRKKMAHALSVNHSVSEACVMLTRQASSRKHLVWLALVNGVLVSAVIGVYVAFSGASTPVPSNQQRGKTRDLAINQITDMASPVAPFVPVIPVIAASSTASAPEITKIAPFVATKVVIAAPKPEVLASAPLKARRFYINVGLFAEVGNARNVHKKLQDAGLASLTQAVETSKGKRTRVRVGPFNTQSEANAAVKKIRALKLDAIVFKQ